MISVKVCADWHTLDTLNGFYRLDDLWKMTGSPEGYSPRDFAASKIHNIASIQLTKSKTWGTQVKLYEYCSFLDRDFKQTAYEVSIIEDVKLALSLALTIATGVQYKKVWA